MNITLLRRARRHFFRDYIPRHVSEHNTRQWLRMIRILGDKWIMVRQHEIARTA